MKQAPALVEVLLQRMGQLVGQRISRINRTHGSMFFLDLGQLIIRNGEKEPHGSWHFLFQSCHWRVASSEAILVGSEDDQDFIDDVWKSGAFGTIESASVTPAGDLQLSFSSGHTLSTLTTSARATPEDWTQWLLFCPDGAVWSIAGGVSSVETPMSHLPEAKELPSKKTLHQDKASPLWVEWKEQTEAQLFRREKLHIQHLSSTRPLWNA